ncbi:glycoside hydrolase family 1 protein [Candidatus Dependentiae bacterium]|nr:glycoside hydrolase family 1 protein [Candidatus Dependentiae bacterium]
MHINITVGMMRILLTALLGFFGATNDYCKTSTNSCTDITKKHWTWKRINQNEYIFPSYFLFGAGTSAHQIEENCDNNTWGKNSRYAQQLRIIKQSEFDKTWNEQKDNWCKNFYKVYCRKPTQAEINQHKEEHFTFCFAGDACKSWQYYKKDVQALKQLGCSAYRFSVAWEKIMPTEDTFDAAALQHYVDVCDELIANNIKPVITLYHYTEPLWFDAKGGFEKAENIKYYVAFCTKIFETLGDRVHLYLTFNSPIGGIALNSYHQGGRPPFKKNSKVTCQVIINLLDAHVAAYKAKELVNPNLKVGILKNTHQLDTWNKWNPIDHLVCKMGNKLQDDPFYQFFTTGKIDMMLPFKIQHENKNAPYSLDFVGLNYYGHRYLKVGLGLSKKCSPKEQRCGTPGNYHESYTIYPEGIYRALMSMHERLIKPLRQNTGRHLPIYVTENGIGTNDENQRTEFMKKYLYAISRAIQNGCDVRGYFYWSLLDNYEWGRYSKCYGLFKVAKDTFDRIIKPSASHYMNLIAAHTKAGIDTLKTGSVNDITVHIVDTQVSIQ